MASNLEIRIGDSHAMSNRQMGAPISAWTVLIICAAMFVIRGPIRAADPAVNMDTPLLLAAATTWRHGGNPYDPASMASTFGASAPLISVTLQRGQQAFVYSPPVYALLSPITYLPWSTQRWVWNLLNVAMFSASLALTCVLFEVPIASLAGFAIIGIGLATNPGHICIALGQTGVVMLFLMCVSWCLVPAGAEYAGRHRIGVAALALAVAALIKPQIAMLFLISDFFTGRRDVAVGAVATAVVLFIAALAIHGNAVVIVQSWIENMHALMHAEADPLHGSLPHQLINLQSPLAVLTGNRTLSTATTILMLLVFYHRVYDAVFLIIPGALAVRQISVGDWRGWILLGVLAPIWIPLSSMVHRGLDMSGGFETNKYLEALLVQHQTWFLLAAFFVLCEARRRSIPS
jgi:hypothetical protein